MGQRRAPVFLPGAESRVPLILLAVVLVVAPIVLVPLSLVLRYRAGTARRQARGWVATLNLVGARHLDLALPDGRGLDDPLGATRPRIFGPRSPRGHRSRHHRPVAQPLGARAAVAPFHAQPVAGPRRDSCRHRASALRPLARLARLASRARRHVRGSPPSAWRARWPRERSCSVTTSRTGWVSGAA